jgi:hypothetical protein
MFGERPNYSALNYQQQLSDRLLSWEFYKKYYKDYQSEGFCSAQIESNRKPEVVVKTLKR